MSFTSRLSNGWTIAISSFKVLGANKQLIIFPVLSGISMLLILGSFVLVLFNASGWDLDSLPHVGRAAGYGILFLFYLVNYFIVVFFNMALIHCTKLYFEGQEVSLKEGIAFSFSRIGAIFSWAVLAAVVGTILKVIQENTGTIGKILIGLIGIVWSVATFFVVPVIAYENVGPIKALERSVQIMKQKWGEGLGAGFSFFLVQLAGLFLFVLPLALIGLLINPLAAILLAVLGVLLLTAVLSAVKMIFISAVYHQINGDIQTHMDQQLVDSLFVVKK
jgi:hypothetical protein